MTFVSAEWFGLLVTYGIWTVVLVALFLFYYFAAQHFKILDFPNRRSSHQQPTIIGGGILFPVTVLLWFVFYDQHHIWVIAALLLISAISLADDITGVKARIRVYVHFVSAAMLLISLGVFGMQWYWIIVAWLLIVGYVNAGNFMDGINGMTAFYHLVMIASILFLSHAGELLPASALLESNWNLSVLLPGRLLGLLFISLLVFAFFNARKHALVFAGDVGSISISFVVAWLLMELILGTGNFYWILFIATYAIDTIYTIVVRLRKKRNPLEAHRQHLHHLLVDRRKHPHLIVSLTYALVQLLVNALTIWLIFTGSMCFSIFLFFVMVLVGIYAYVRRAALACRR
jgi:UDP-GlcNAc:undecaprenyl-phosphate/decaprenyl-phosphate GlcNAc-1-phosphate transferase